MSTRVGWIGAGRMGVAMATRLLQAGYGLAVWNRTPSKAEPLREKGAEVGANKQDLAECAAVFTMVGKDNDLMEVLFGSDGLVAGPKKPRMVIDSSSISEGGSAEVRRKLEAVGVGFLAAPVSGNAKVCKSGKLSVVASGPKRFYDEAQPWLAAFGRGTVWLGEGELARTWKIAHNTFLTVVIQSLCEITVLAQKAGIPRNVFLESINNSVMGSMFTRYKTPTLVNLTFDQVSFTPPLLLKDIDLGLRAGHLHGVPMPCAATVRESIAALVGRGYDHIDFGVLLMEIARDSGFEPQPEGVAVSDGLD